MTTAAEINADFDRQAANILAELAFLVAGINEDVDLIAGINKDAEARLRDIVGHEHPEDHAAAEIRAAAERMTKRAADLVAQAIAEIRGKADAAIAALPQSRQTSGPGLEDELGCP
jgi:hypothetical protein